MTQGLFLSGILTHELTEGMICSAVHAKLTRVQAARQMAASEQGGNLIWVHTGLCRRMGRSGVCSPEPLPPHGVSERVTCWDVKPETASSGAFSFLWLRGFKKELTQRDAEPFGVW